MLEHRFTVDGYIAFLVEFDEETLFAELEPDLRERLIATLRERLTALSADQMTMRFPIVFASGRRSRASSDASAGVSPRRTRVSVGRALGGRTLGGLLALRSALADLGRRPRRPPRRAAPGPWR